MKRFLGVLIRVAIAAAIIVYIFRTKVDPADFLEKLRSVQVGWAALAFACFGVCLALGVIRWSILLRVQGIVIRPLRLLSISFIGHFFNAFMLGATGGDLVKAYYIARETHRKKAEVVVTIVVDRLVGLYGLFAIAAVMMVVQFPFYRAHSETWAPALYVAGLILAGTVGIFLLFQKQWFLRLPFVPRLVKRLPGRALLSRLYDAFFQYRHHRSAVLAALSLAVVIHSSLIFAVFFLSLGFGEPLSIPAAYALAPLILCIAAIPITPGGWGIREGLFALLFPAAGVSEETAVAISVLYGAIALVYSLMGGIPYLLHRAEIPTDAADDEPPSAA